MAKRTVIGAIAVLVAATGFFAVHWATGRNRDASITSIDVIATPFAELLPGADRQQFGTLKFIGGLELQSEAKAFGGYSGIRLSADGTRLLAISDAGTWLTGTIERDPSGRLKAIANAQIGPLLTDDKGRLAPKSQNDAEAIEVEISGTQSHAIVAFERNHRIAEMPLSGLQPSGTAKTVLNDFNRFDLPTNRGIEAVALFPENSPYAGALIALTEQALNKQGNIRAFIVKGDRIDELAIAPDGFNITDADFLPDGDLVLLERRFTFQDGVAMRLRRIPAAELVPGATANGDVMLAADRAYNIDNMEGLDIFVGADGATHLMLISDDNFAFIQQTLLLEFVLTDASTAPSN